MCTAWCGCSARRTRGAVSVVLVVASVGAVVVVSCASEVRVREQEGRGGDHPGDRPACPSRPRVRVGWCRVGVLGSGRRRSECGNGACGGGGWCRGCGVSRAGTQVVAREPALRGGVRAPWCRHGTRGGPCTEYDKKCDRRVGGGGSGVACGCLAHVPGVVPCVGGEAHQHRCSDQQAPQQRAGGSPARQRLLGWECLRRCVHGLLRRERRRGRRGRASRCRGGQRQGPGGRRRFRVGWCGGCVGVIGTLGGAGSVVSSSPEMAGGWSWWNASHSWEWQGAVPVRAALSQSRQHAPPANRGGRLQPGVVHGAIWTSGWGGGGAGRVAPLAWTVSGRLRCWRAAWAGPAGLASSRARLGAGSGLLGGGWAWLGASSSGRAAAAGSSAAAGPSVDGALAPGALAVASLSCSSRGPSRSPVGASLSAWAGSVAGLGVDVSVGAGLRSCSGGCVLVWNGPSWVGAGSVHSSVAASPGLAGE